MDIRKVDDEFAVSPQLLPGEVPAVAAAGYTTIICNRPDGEEAGQPASADIEQAASAAGLAFHYLPISGGFSAAAVEQFRTLRQAASGPVLGFCRSGTRSIMLNALANPDGLSAEELIAGALAAGYDISPLRDRLTG